MCKTDQTIEQRGNYFISVYIGADYMCNDAKGNLQKDIQLQFLGKKCNFETGWLSEEELAVYTRLKES